MRRVLILSASGAVTALGLAACHPPHPHPHVLKTIAALDCPETQGDLERKSQAADGQTCAYASDDGDQVTLQLVKLNGRTLKDALAPIQSQVEAEAPAGPPDADVTPPRPPAPGAPPPPPPLAPKGHDNVDIDLPGLHIHTTGDGHADVDAGGVHVVAHDHDGQGSDRAEVKVGGGDKAVTIHAHEGGARIEVNDSGTRESAVFMLVGDQPGPHGFKAAGYEARGPKGGPVVVAVVLSRSQDHDDLHHDAGELIRRNVGG